MSNSKQCVDIYGERLKIGDEVIPVLEEALIIGIGGFISKIEYSEEYNNNYITIVDETGKILLDGVDSRCYTTQERFDDRENEDYIYWLYFFNDKLSFITSIPLTKWTDKNFEIPDDTHLINLTARHITDKTNCSVGYTFVDMYSFIFDKDIKKIHNKKSKGHYAIDEVGNMYPISKNYKVVKTEEELKKYVKKIIKCFKKIDDTLINNDDLITDKKETKEFEKKLVHKINKKIKKKS